MPEPSGKKLDVLYRMAWLRGLKTTYYLRTLGASNVEKSTLASSTSHNAVPISCGLTQECEVCQ
jgi:ribonucleoside-diphosphate reductase alpha chain